MEFSSILMKPASVLNCIYFTDVTGAKSLAPSPAVKLQNGCAVQTMFIKL